MMHRFEHPWMYGPPPDGDGFWLPGMVFSALSTLFWLALLIGLLWALLRWIIPSLKPMITDIFGTNSTHLSALEILRQRYARGEIDAYSFEQMRERLVASYPQESIGKPLDDYSNQGEQRPGYGSMYTPPVTYEQGKASMAEQEYYSSESDR